MKPIIEQLEELLQPFEPHWVSPNGKKYFTIDDVVKDGVDPKTLKKANQNEVNERLFGRKNLKEEPLKSGELYPIIELMKRAYSHSSTSRSYALKHKGVKFQILPNSET